MDSLAILVEIERDFLRGLVHALDIWRNLDRIDFPRSRKIVPLVRFYIRLFNDFFRLDHKPVEDLFTERFGSDLFDYFSDYYSADNLPLFIAFVCHLIFEENLGLFFSRLEPTGRYCGNWATGHQKPRAIGELLERRIEASLGKDGFADLYHQAYAGGQHLLDPVLTQIHSSAENIEAGEQPTADDSEKETILKVLLGSSIGSLLLGLAVKQITQDRHRVWRPTSSSNQIMFTFGHLPGSVKLYGFCLEMPKTRPSSNSQYHPMYSKDLEPSAAAAYHRIPAFLDVFSAFGESRDPELMTIASVDNGRKIWHTLQRFFWLITQPYRYSDASDEQLASEFVSHYNGQVVPVIQQCITIMDERGITVHSSNMRVFEIIRRRVIIE